MKKINIIFKKTIVIALIFSFLISPLTIKKADAGVSEVAAIVAQTGVKIANFVKNYAVVARNYIETAKMAYTTGRMAIDTAKNLKNFDLETFAKNASGELFMQLSQTVMENVSTLKGIGINVYTDGKQVVVNLDNFLDYVGINEIKRGLADFKTAPNTTPYTGNIQRAVAEFTRKTKDTATGKLVNFTLPYVAKSEICNSPKLKEIIMYGEPETFVRAKKPVANIDISTLCNTSLSDIREGAKAQAIFVGLAKAGYGGALTNIALSDYMNTPSGVIAAGMSALLERKDKVVESVSKQTEATGLFIGNQVCLDKNDRRVPYDPTDPDLFCYQMASTATSSGAMIREQVTAAADAPYKAILAKADAINNKLGDGISKTFDIISFISYLVGMGQKDIDALVQGEDNPYSQLADSLTDLQKTQKKQEGIYKQGALADELYNFGTTTKYTMQDLQEKLELYSRIRVLNTQRLNSAAYTYLVLKFTVANQAVAIEEATRNAWNQQKKVFMWIFGRKKAKEAWKILDNKVVASQRFITALINIQRETRLLIKEMARNNYREQQMRKLLEELRTTEQVDTQNNQEALAQALDETLTTKDYEMMMEDWDYFPRYQKVDSDPHSAQPGDASKYVPNDDELYGPYSDNNLLFLRIRAYNLLQETGKKKALTAEEKEMLKGFGIIDYATGLPSLEKLTPNIERPSRAPSLIQPDTSITFSEAKFCEYQKLKICDMRELQILIDQFDMMDDPVTLTEEEELLREQTCADPETSLRDFCAQNANDNSYEIREICDDLENNIIEFREACSIN